MPEEVFTGHAISERIVRLSRTLQARGVDVALSELIDAAQAATAIDLGNREELRVALQATLIKHEHHIAEFNAAFDRLFPARPPRAAEGDGGTTASDAAARLADGSDLGRLGADLIDAHAGLDGELRSEGHHLQRALRGADLARMMSEARRLDPTLSGDELLARLEELKALMAADIRGQIGEPEPVEIDPAVEDLDFLRSSRTELAAMRDAVRPLTRKIASRLARRRRSLRGGKVHLRRTARRSVATGGVPFDVAVERPRAHRPELYVLCDISGSVADFSFFILTFMAALSAELAKTRSFVFVDAIDEITELMSRTDHGIEPWQIMRNTNVIGADGHSDYGAVLQQFWDEIGQADLRATSTVLICGDARTNHRTTKASVLEHISRRARRVYWLNPEPRSHWGTHDSEMEAYTEFCTAVFEVRTLRQLAQCVDDIL